MLFQSNGWMLQMVDYAPGILVSEYGIHIRKPGYREHIICRRNSSYEYETEHLWNIWKGTFWNQWKAGHMKGDHDWLSFCFVVLSSKKIVEYPFYVYINNCTMSSTLNFISWSHKERCWLTFQFVRQGRKFHYTYNLFANNYLTN